MIKFNKINLLTKILKLMKNNEKKTPFFAKFLENQLKEELRYVKGAGIGGTVTLPLLDSAVTMKWPSDSDEDNDGSDF